MQCPIISIHMQYGQNLMKLGIYKDHMALLQELEYFLIWASTSGVRVPPGAKASFYSLQGNLRIFICLSFQKCIINDTFDVNYLKCYSYNVRNCFL